MLTRARANSRKGLTKRPSAFAKKTQAKMRKKRNSQDKTTFFANVAQIIPRDEACAELQDFASVQTT
jgi:acetyl-CoA carboxylase carboxyltransferase component